MSKPLHLDRGALRRLALSVLLPGFTGTTPPAWVRRSLADGLAGVCLFGQNVEGSDQVRALTTALRAERSDVLVASDEEGGSVTRLDAGLGSPWPGAATLGALDDEGATYEVALGIGRHAASVGVDLVLAPVLDVGSEPDNPVIGVRSFGATPEIVTRHGVAFVRGLQDAGVNACAKHFPGHGATRTDSHVGLPVLDVDERTWRERDLAPFAAACRAGVRSVMTAHVVVTAVDQEPATLSAPVLRILREDLAFDGAVVSDALDMRAVSDRGGRAAAAVRALAAGVDLLCVGNPVFPDSYDEEAAVEEIVSAVGRGVEDGTLPPSRLREASSRVATLSSPRPGVGLGQTDRESMLALGASIAARAVTVVGDPRLGDDALVLAPRTATSYAAGHKTSALLTELQRRRPGWRFVEVTAAGAARAEAEAAAGRVAVLVDGRADRDTTEVVSTVLGAVPEAVVVYGGLARADDEGTHTIHTHGTGAATAVAAADLLLGEGT